MPFSEKIQHMIEDELVLRQRAADLRGDIMRQAQAEVVAHPPYPIGTTFKDTFNHYTYRISGWTVEISHPIAPGPVRVRAVADVTWIVNGKVKPTIHRPRYPAEAIEAHLKAAVKEQP